MRLLFKFSRLKATNVCCKRHLHLHRACVLLSALRKVSWQIHKNSDREGAGYKKKGWLGHFTTCQAPKDANFENYIFIFVVYLWGYSIITSVPSSLSSLQTLLNFYFTFSVCVRVVRACCLHVRLCTTVCSGRGGHKSAIPGTGVADSWGPPYGCWVIWKSSSCSQPLSHLSSPTIFLSKNKTLLPNKTN